MFKPVGEVRNKSADEVKDFAATNPEMLDDPNKASSKSKPIKAKNPRNIIMPTSKASSEGEKKDVDFAIFEKAISDQESVLRDGEFVTLGDDSTQSSNAGIENPSAHQGRTDLSYLESLKGKYGISEESSDQITKQSSKEVSSSETEKIFSTFDRKIAQIKALENEILGFKTTIDKDFNGEWIVYRHATAIINFDPKNPNFKPINSGIYMDPQEGLWYLNTEDNVKYLVHTGALSSTIGVKRPENYDVVREYTPGSGLFLFEGSDLKHILNPEYMNNLGIKVADSEKGLFSLETYSKQDLQNLFIANGINIFITEM